MKKPKTKPAAVTPLYRWNETTFATLSGEDSVQKAISENCAQWLCDGDAGTKLPANTNAALGPEMQVISHKLCSLQVCVPESTTDATVETFANQARPTGIESRWKIRRQGDPALAGTDERVKCTGRAGCVHIMLDC